MRHQLLKSTEEIIYEIDKLKTHLKDWENAVGINKLELYSYNYMRERYNISYVDMEIFTDIFKELKTMIIERLEAKISKLQKEFDEL